VVARDSAIEPDDGRRAKIVGEQLLIGRPVHGRVAVLGGREQAFFSGEQSAAAIDVDRSAFEHDAVLSAERPYNASAGGLRHALSNFFVMLVIRVLGPGVELKVQSEEPRIGVIGGRRQEDAAGVARPYAIGAPAVKANIVGK